MLHGALICGRTEDAPNGLGGPLQHGERRLHALRELGIVERSPSKFHFAFESGKVAHSNSLLAYLLSDKRKLSLLSRHTNDEGCFSEEERAVIHGRIPWSRNVEGCPDAPAEGDAAAVPHCSEPTTCESC